MNGTGVQFIRNIVLVLKMVLMIEVIFSVTTWMITILKKLVRPDKADKSASDVLDASNVMGGRLISSGTVVVSMLKNKIMQNRR